MHHHSPEHYACLDIGTNSVLLLLASRAADGRVREHAELFRATRLGRGVDRTGQLDPAGIAATLAAVGDFAERARAFAGRPLVWAVVATSAVRDAANRHLFLEPCAEICGCLPRTLTGEEEAATVFAGAVSDLDDESRAVVVDVGGGSTEIVAGVGRTSQFHASLNMGCVRFAEKFGLAELPESAAVEAARRGARQLLAPVVAGLHAAFPDARRCQILASGGTATSFAALAQSLPSYCRDRVHGFTTPVGDVAKTTLELGTMTLAERQKLPALNEGRALVLPAGMIILDECLKALAARTVRVTTRGLRFGLATRLASGNLAPAMTWLA